MTFSSLASDDLIFILLIIFFFMSKKDIQESFKIMAYFIAVISCIYKLALRLVFEEKDWGRESVISLGNDL